ncbi:MAG: phosphate ABC transporter permease PstA [Ruminococcaceae bacterium]|nr:phosphate ABC transporter permease PstA [Oscillospiraceae bacterium]
MKTDKSTQSKGKSKIRIGSILMRLSVFIAASITVIALLFIIGYILINGIPHLKPSLFAREYTSENVSLVPALINTLIVVFFTLLIAVPLGVGAAIYLVEYSNNKGKLATIARTTAETLSGIPSIVFGLFGMLMFVEFFGWGYSLLAGIFTLSILILPLIMRTAEEALKAVPVPYREGSFALGAGKLRTIFKVVLPAAKPGIISGIILAIGRIVGETAALIYTSGIVANVPKNLLGSGRTLALHMFALSSEALHMNEASATAVVLIVLVLFINWLSKYATKDRKVK